MKQPAKILITALLLIFLFLFIGCSNLLRAVGYSQAEIDDLQGEAADKGQPGPADADAALWQCITIAASAAGAITSGILAKWLRVEKRTTKAMILGIEDTASPEVKKNVSSRALELGIEDHLHTIVKKLIPSTPPKPKGAVT